MTSINLIKNKYTLDKFQQEACDYIDDKYNILVSAPTGSGKTAIAEYSIELTKRNNSKLNIIYTCPIKSLCNEKYRDMNINYSINNYKIGLMTGDIIINPDADIVVMTTEVLYNLIINNNDKEESNSLNNLGCIIFDEVHYINDDSRGHVWEKCIISSLLKYDCLLVLLSATIGNIDQLLEWLNSINENKKFKKVIKFDRPVPLREYIIDNTKCRNFKKNNNLEKDEKDNNKIIEKDILYEKSNVTNDPNEDMYELLALNEKNYNTVKKYWSKLSEINYSIDFELETLCNQIRSNPNLGIPAIIFVLSKIKCIEYAEMITSSFIDHNEENQILKFYDDNLIEFKLCSQYINLRKTISKGIAYHHSGLIPKIREVVEFLIKNKLIKIVFATETFAVGLNFPVKTVVLTGLNKPTENGFRDLNVSEYKQMAGRAGRRFIDKVGNVIIWLYKKNYNHQYQPWIEINRIINGSIDIITSKYIIEPNYILKNITSNNYKLISDHSFKYYKLKNEIKNKYEIPEKFKKLFDIEQKIISFGLQGVNYVDKNYNKLINKLSKDDQIEYKRCFHIYKNNSKKTEYELYIDLEDSIIEFLIDNNFIIKEINENSIKYSLSAKGLISEYFNEINPVFFVENMDWILSIKENILPILSIFIDDGIKENDNKIIDHNNPIISYIDNLIKKKYLPYFNKYPKWVYNPLNLDLIKTWLINPNFTLDDQSKYFNVDMGLIVKILIKMYQICDELISNLIKINRTDLTEYLTIQKSLLIREPLKIDSLYINN